jgi:hypothetical protein
MGATQEAEATPAAKSSSASLLDGLSEIKQRLLDVRRDYGLTQDQISRSNRIISNDAEKVINDSAKSPNRDASPMVEKEFQSPVNHLHGGKPRDAGEPRSDRASDIAPIGGEDLTGENEQRNRDIDTGQKAAVPE